MTRTQPIRRSRKHFQTAGIAILALVAGGWTAPVQAQRQSFNRPRSPREMRNATVAKANVDKRRRRSEEQTAMPGKQGGPNIIIGNVKGATHWNHKYGLVFAYGATFDVDSTTFGYYYPMPSSGLRVQVQDMSGNTVLDELDTLCNQPGSSRTTMSDFNCNANGKPKSLKPNTTYRMRLYLQTSSSHWHTFTTPPRQEMNAARPTDLKPYADFQAMARPLGQTGSTPGSSTPGGSVIGPPSQIQSAPCKLLLLSQVQGVARPATGSDQVNSTDVYGVRYTVPSCVFSWYYHSGSSVEVQVRDTNGNIVLSEIDALCLNGNATRNTMHDFQCGSIGPVTSLKSGTMYQVRLKSGQAEGPWYTFTTPSASPSSL